jgi:GTP-binding protein
VVYASALNGYASLDPDVRDGDMTPLFETIIKHVPAPNVDVDAPFQMQVISLDYSSYVGAIAVGRIKRGKVKSGQNITVVERDGKTRNGRILQVLGFMGLERTEVPEASAGDIVAITGVEHPHISDTFCDPAAAVALPALTVDEPTVTMSFEVNNSPFAGQDGKFVTSRQIRERLERELITNVALRMEETDSPDKFRVSGRGELHLGILIENMRREGYELGVSRPQVIVKMISGIAHEPYETLTVDVEQQHQGVIMEKLGMRKGDLQNMEPDGKGRVRLEYMIPSRGLIGFRNEFLTATQGSGLLYSTFDHYGPVKGGDLKGRQNGVLISNGMGESVAYALFNLQERGRMFSAPGEEMYEGMIIGIHSRDNDLVVNAMKGKQLTNMRASGSDEAVILTPPIQLTLDRAIEFIEDDELVEVTPHHIRLRKRFLKETDRKRAERASA